MTLADRSGDAFLRMVYRTTHADALHQAGRRSEALALFREAERQQREDEREYPRLYWVPGFQYCDLLLAEAERGAGREGVAEADGAAIVSESLEALREVEERAAQTLHATLGALPVRPHGTQHLVPQGRRNLASGFNRSRTPRTRAPTRPPQ